jgi:hypothetical protein
MSGEVIEKRKLWDELIARAKKLDHAYVRVGVLEEKGSVARGDGGMTLVEIAATHEFGSSDGRIPERSFIRSTFLIRRVNALRTFQEKLARAIVTKGLDPIKALNMLGAWGAAEVKNTITEIDIPPPLADSTVQRKGSSKPLVDTGLLKNSISYEVVENDESLGIGNGSRTTMPERSA